MNTLRDHSGDVGRYEPTDRELDRLMSGSLDLPSELDPLGSFFAALREQSRTDIAKYTIATQARSAAVVATNTAQQLIADQAEAAARTEHTERTLLLASFRRRIATVAATAAMFIGSLSGVAIAADHAKPGDLLYGIDRALESIGIGNGDVDERLEEVHALLDSGDVPRGLQHAADILEAKGPNHAAASAALLDAADRVVSHGSEQSAAVREDVAALLSRISDGALGSDDLSVFELARRIGRPDDPGNKKPAGDRGRSADAPGHADFTPGESKPPARNQ